MGWATFRAKLSPTLPVTLLPRYMESHLEVLCTSCFANRMVSPSNLFFFVVSNVRTAPEEFSVLLTEAELQVVEWQNLKKFLKMGNRCGSAVK
jgi:hypothetical protein